MAFTKETWARGSCHANSDIPTLWLYRSETDNEGAVEAAGYFNEVADQVQVGDRISMYLVNGSSHEDTVVTANDGTTVTIQGLRRLVAD